MSARLTAAKKVKFSLAVLAAAFLCLEIAARVVVWVRAPSAVEGGGSTLNTASIFGPHPFLAYTANPAHADHSAQGFREEEVFALGQESFRIVCVGGSSTYGTRVRREESYPSLLERQLGETGQAVEVINAGLAGYSTPNLIALLSLRVLDLQPKVCLFYTGFNDVWNRIGFAGLQPDYANAMRSWERTPAPLWRASTLLDKVAGRLGHRFDHDPHIHAVCWREEHGDPAENYRSSSPEPFRRNLLTLVAICRAHGVRPILCTQATDFAGHPLPANTELWIEAMDEAERVVREVASTQGVDLVDVAGPMTNRSELFADCLHMNAEGNRTRARIIAEHLRTHGIVPVRQD